MKFEVNIHKVFTNEKRLRAIASVVMDNAFVVHDVRVIESDKGLFISMPYRVHKDEEGKEIRRDVFHPISSDARNEMESAVIAAYKAKIEKQAE